MAPAKKKKVTKKKAPAKKKVEKKKVAKKKAPAKKKTKKKVEEEELDDELDLDLDDEEKEEEDLDDIEDDEDEDEDLDDLDLEVEDDDDEEKEEEDLEPPKKRGRGKKKKKPVEEHEEAEETAEEPSGDFLVRLNISELCQISELNQLCSEWAAIVKEDVGEGESILTAKGFENKKAMTSWIEEQLKDDDSEIVYILKKGRPRLLQMKMKFTFA